MIRLNLRFGRSARLASFSFLLPAIALMMTLSLFSDAQAIGKTGLYATKFKVEYQYSDYDKYKFPAIEYADSIKYEYIDPYILDFPESRTLGKITQALGPKTDLEIRYEFSDLSEAKQQSRYFARMDRDISNLMTLYGSYQHLAVDYTAPDSNDVGANMVSLGLKYDRSGWIKAEASFSYDHSRAPDDMLTQTYMPMLKLRWSIDPVTAISARWDGYWSVNDNGTYPSHAMTVFVSRYFPTQTALHLFSRFYTNDSGVESISPSVEVAQYIYWNLTARLTYRFYRNWFDEESAPEFIEGSSISAHAFRAYIEWQFRSNMKLHLKLRNYQSDQDIRMNTYLLGLEVEV